MVNTSAPLGDRLAAAELPLVGVMLTVSPSRGGMTYSDTAYVASPPSSTLSVVGVMRTRAIEV